MYEWDVPYEEEDNDMEVYKAFIEEMDREPESQSELIAFYELKVACVFE